MVDVLEVVCSRNAVSMTCGSASQVLVFSIFLCFRSVLKHWPGPEMGLCEGSWGGRTDHVEATMLLDVTAGQRAMTAFVFARWWWQKRRLGRCRGELLSVEALCNDRCNDQR